jgi:hypothetical protein
VAKDHCDGSYASAVQKALAVEARLNEIENQITDAEQITKKK